MKLLVVSDEESKYIWEHFDPQPFKGVEVILSCGDLKASYLEFLVCMIPAPLFYVPGNHDKKFTKDSPEGVTNIDGELVVHKGLRIAGLGGCMSGARELHEYTEKEQAKRVSRLEKKIKRAKGVDILVTHVSARGLGDGEDNFHKGFESYRQLLDKYEPSYHFFGHQHKCYSRKCGPPSYNNTKLINACGYKIIEL